MPLHTARLVLEPVSHAHDNDLFAGVAGLASRAPALDAVGGRPVHGRAVAPTPTGPLPEWEAGSPAFAITEHGIAIGVIGLTRGPTPSTRSTTGSPPIAPVGATSPRPAQALLEWAREALGARRIVLHAGMENRRSLAVAERLGFTRDGELEGGMTGGSVAVFPAYRHHLDL